jgi:hypothetical protein
MQWRPIRLVPMMQHNSCCAFDSLAPILTLLERWVRPGTSTRKTKRKKKKKKKRKKNPYAPIELTCALVFRFLLFFCLAFDTTRRVNSVLARVDAVRRAAGWADELPPSGARDDFVFCIRALTVSFDVQRLVCCGCSVPPIRPRCGSMRVARWPPTDSRRANSSNIALSNAISTLFRATVGRRDL